MPPTSSIQPTLTFLVDDDATQQLLDRSPEWICMRGYHCFTSMEVARELA